VGDPQVVAAVRIATASLLLGTGDRGGWPLVDRLRSDPTLLAQPREHARACLNWAQGALDVGDLPRAESLLGVLCLVDALHGRGSAEQAASHVDELAAGLAGRYAPAAHAAPALSRGVLAFAGDDRARAVELAGTAAAWLAALGLRYDAALAEERLGGWADRTDAAVRHLEHALREFSTLGASQDAARVARTMRERGVAVPYPWRGGRRAYGSQMSPREREVARLAATGLTNQQIAAQLYLSRRTVESHIASVLRKLGGSSRKDLPALIRAHEADR